MTIVDDVHFGPSVSGESFGRLTQHPGRMLPLGRPSLGAMNTAARVGLVVISEVHYHPAAPGPDALAIDPQLEVDDLEFVEILNPASQTADLSQWRLQGGIDFTFPTDLLLAAGETIIVVSFDPDRSDNAQRTRALRAQYELHSEVRLVGGYAGQLSDSQDRVRLERLALPAGQQLIRTSYRGRQPGWRVQFRRFRADLSGG